LLLRITRAFCPQDDSLADYANIRDCELRRIIYLGRMAVFLYRCPATGFNVQGLVPDFAPALDESNESRYEAVTCTICSRVHLINPTTGHVAGTDAKPRRRAALPAARRTNKSGGSGFRCGES